MMKDPVITPFNTISELEGVMSDLKGLKQELDRISKGVDRTLGFVQKIYEYEKNRSGEKRPFPPAD